MLEIILFVMSLVVNLILIIIVIKFRDLIKFGLKLRKVLRDRGYLNMTAEDLNETIGRWEKFTKPFLHPEDEKVPLPAHMQAPGAKEPGV